MTLADVFHHVDTLVGDPWPVIRQLAASDDRALVAPVQAALERYLDEHNWYGRDLMAYLLIGLRGTAAFPLVLRAFARPLRGDDRDNLCAWLAEVMSADPAGCRPTVHSFITAEHPDLREAGVWALGYLLQPDDLPLLRKALADSDPRVRRSALGSLPGLETDQQAFELAISGLRDPDEATRATAVSHLRWFANPAAVEHLIPLSRDSAVQVRSVLGGTIARLAVDSEHAPAAAAVLLSLLADPAPQVRADAARGLGVLGGRLDALPASAGDPDPRVRAAIAAALGSHAGPHLAETLHAIASDESTVVRADLVTALGGCGWSGARPLIVALTQDPDRSVRDRAEVALTRLCRTGSPSSGALRPRQPASRQRAVQPGRSAEGSHHDDTERPHES